MASIEIMWLSVAAYLGIQSTLLLTTSGPIRRAMAIPVFVVIPAFVLTVLVEGHGTDIWLATLACVSPFASLYLVVNACRILPRKRVMRGFVPQAFE